MEAGGNPQCEAFPKTAEQHQVGQYHGKQKIFCQVVDEVQAVCELEVEYFIPGFCFYMECPVKNEQQQGVGDGYRYQK